MTALSRISRVERVALNTRDAEGLATFYVDGLGFARIAAAPNSASTAPSDPLSLRLGRTRLDLIPAAGRPYPPDVAGWNPLFQHCAIVVTDMTRALEILETLDGWTAISVAGPQTLPANTGGVTAFKFRDPDGHPLELLALPEATATSSGSPFVRIDHSAISVADVAASIKFYERLGLTVAARSLNVGIEQERLDAVPGATVDVVTLRPPGDATPHVELLGYRGHDDRPRVRAAVDDVAATRLVFAVASAAALARLAGEHWQDAVAASATGVVLRDPDGHLLAFVVDDADH